MAIPLHLWCLRMIEQVEDYRKVQDRCAPMSQGSVEPVYKALSQRERRKSYFFHPPSFRVHMADGDHGFHGI